MKPVYLKENVGKFQAGTYVWLYRVKDHNKQFVSKINDKPEPYGPIVLDHQYEPPNCFIDADLQPVKVGDTIVRLNTTDNKFNLEKRLVLASSPEGLLLSPKHGGRPTSTAVHKQVIKI